MKAQIGDMVHYHGEQGTCFAAIVTGFAAFARQDPMPILRVFLPISGGRTRADLQVEAPRGATVGTWHERAYCPFQVSLPRSMRPGEPGQGG